MATDAKAEVGQQRQVELAIGGMTCASCATRVEKKLNRMDGVDATVNLATERAHVLVAKGVSDTDLISTVEATGYTAQVPVARANDSETGYQEKVLKPRLIAAAILTVPVLVLSMIPAAQFEGWGWVAWGSRCRSSPGRPGRSTGPPRSTPGTSRPPWTHWCRSESSRPHSGRWAP